MKTKPCLSLFLTSAFCTLWVVALAGCSEKRPDPRENPDFDEETYNDPDAAMKMMKGDKAPK